MEIKTKYILLLPDIEEYKKYDGQNVTVVICKYLGTKDSYIIKNNFPELGFIDRVPKFKIDLTIDKKFDEVKL